MLFLLTIGFLFLLLAYYLVFFAIFVATIAIKGVLTCVVTRVDSCFGKTATNTIIATYL